MTLQVNKTNSFTGIIPSFSIKNKMTPIGIEDNTQSGIIKSSFDTLADIRKFTIKAEEYPKGVAVGVAKGGITGALAMGAFWAVNRVAGKGIEGQGWVKTPLETAAKITKALIGKLIRLPGKTIGQIAAYPVWTGPKQLHSYLKTVKGVGTIGKTLAVGVGIGVAAMEMFKTKLKVNQKTAEIDHKFYTGHRNV